MQHLELNRIAEGLAHLLPAPEQHAVNKHCARQLDACAHQERRPVNRVKPQYVFADHMKRGPVSIEVIELTVAPTECGYVIGKRIKPDVDGMARITGNRYAPLDRNAAHRKVF